jgi:transposase-like protein
MKGLYPFQSLRTMTNRHVKSPFWTPEQDALLQNLQAGGVSIDKIAKRLGVTSTAVQRRSYHLRGLKFRSYGLRASALESRKRCETEAIAAMRSAIRQGIPRDTIIAQAVKVGLRRSIIASEFGLNPRTVFRLALLEGTPKFPARGRPRRGARPGYDELPKAKRAEHRKLKKRLTRDAIAAMHTAISRGVPRDMTIAQASKTGVTYKAIADELGLSRQRIHQIVLRHEAVNSPLRAPMR